MMKDTGRTASSPPDTFHPSHNESQFIAATRLLMICGLAYHHLFEIPGSINSPRLNMESYTHFAPDLINSLVHMAFMVAVPLLSVISGYLFFRRNTVDFGRLLKKRFYSVALPSWLWAALWLAFAYGLYKTSSNPALFPWANYGFENFTFMTLLNGIVGITQHPFAFQFWFVHDLLLTLLISPFIYFFIKRLGWPLLVLLVAIWFFVPSLPFFFSSNVPMFFSIGTFLALQPGPGLQNLLHRLEPFRWPVLAAFAAALLARLFAHTVAGLTDLTQSYAYLCLLRLLGVLAFSLVLFAMVQKGQAAIRLLVTYSGYSFFIFATHYPLIQLYKLAASSIPGSSSALGFTLIWLLTPLATIVTAVAVAKASERFLPSTFRLLNGGRSTG